MSQRPDPEEVALVAPSAGAARLKAVLAAAPPESLGAPLVAAPPSKCLVAPAERVRDEIDIGAALREAFACVTTGDQPPEGASAIQNAWVTGVNNRNGSQDQLVQAVILLANMIKILDSKITTVVKQNFGVVSAEVNKNGVDLKTLKQTVETDVADLNAQFATLRTQFREKPWTTVTEDNGRRIGVIEAKIGEALRFEEAAQNSSRDLGSSIKAIEAELVGLKKLIGQNNVSSELDALKERLDALPSPADMSAILKAVEKQPNLDGMNKAVKSAEQVATQNEGSLKMPPMPSTLEPVKVARQKSGQTPQKAEEDDVQPGTQEDVQPVTEEDDQTGAETKAMPKSVEDLYSAMMKQSVEFL